MITREERARDYKSFSNPSLVFKIVDVNGKWDYFKAWNALSNVNAAMWRKQLFDMLRGVR